MSEIRDDSLAAIVAGLETRRGHLGQVIACTDEAIAALRKLEAACTPAAALSAAVSRALPPARPAPPASRIHGPKAAAVDRNGHRVHGASRPRSAVCKNERCGQSFAVKDTGRLPFYCSDVCRTAVGKRARRDVAAEAPAPPIAPPEPIPESASGMKARIKQALEGTGEPPRSRFLETVRGKNDARRARTS